MKIALAQLNPTIGDIEGNTALIRTAIDQAGRRGAKLVVTPELSIIGYPPKDLLLKPAVIDHCTEAVDHLAAECTGIAAIIGYPCPSDQPDGRLLYNAAAFCRDGRVVHRHVKSLLPTYDVFDETRYFEPARGAQEHQPIEWDGRRLGVTICEDLWNDRDLLPRQLYHHDPLQDLVDAGAQLIVNCSASPFVVEKPSFRLELFAAAARRHQLPIIYCNQVGGNDELVFDGNSFVLNPDGHVVAHARAFEPDLLMVDLEHAQPVHPPRPASIDSVYHALVLGLRDYCHKCGFKSIVVGLSGGIDSAVTGALAVAALGANRVRGVAMPSRHSSSGSVDDARTLAQNMGIEFYTVPIAEPHDAFEALLAPHFEGRPPDVTEENVQARIRGVILMAFSNKFGSLLVTTGNKSELAVGYCTLYGDMAGGLAILSDVPKTMVWQLAKWINTAEASPLRQGHGRAVIPESSILKPPSAELRPDQTDQDSLPSYELLDQIIERYVEREQSARTIIEQMPDAPTDTVLRVAHLIDLNEYKRKQSAPGIKVTGRAFGFGRRMPIAQRYDSGRAAAQPVADK